MQLLFGLLMYFSTNAQEVVKFKKHSNAINAPSWFVAHEPLL